MSEYELEAYLAEPEAAPFAPPPDERPLSPEQWDFDYSQRSAAIEAVEAETNQAERLSYVEGRAKEFGLTDPQAFARVDQLVTEAQGETYKNLMAAGYTEWQAREELASLDYDAVIDMALEQERYLKFTEGTSLARWREGRAQMDANRAREGKPPLPSPFDSPTHQRQARASAAYVERQRQWREGAMAAYRRQVGL